MMKKTLYLILILLFINLLLGCTKVNAPDTEMINPVHDSSADEIQKSLGISFDIPADAQNISYYTVVTDEGKPIAQATFMRTSQNYTYRIRATEAFEDISGAYYEWMRTQVIDVGNTTGEIWFIEGEEGVCLWYDEVSGLMHSVFTDSGATAASLESLANELYANTP